jgi:hypothetical protein
MKGYIAAVMVDIAQSLMLISMDIACFIIMGFALFSYRDDYGMNRDRLFVTNIPGRMEV